MNPSELHFAALEGKLAEYGRTQQSLLRASRWGRRCGWAMALGLLTTMLAPKLLAPSWMLVAAVALGLAIEIAGAIGLAILQVREALPAIRDKRGEFAQRLDHEFVMYREIVTWLRSHDITELRSRLAYVRGRRDMMRRKLGMLIGGIERLGILPLLVAFYFQLHHLTTWPPHFTRTEGLVIWGLVLVYGVGWWAATTALRMDLYEQLLSDALDARAGA